MFLKSESSFKSYDVLHADALNAGLNGSVKLVEQLFTEYSDGILREVIIEQQDGYLAILGGTLKYQGNIYFLNDEIRIRLVPNNKMLYLKIVFGERQTRNGMSVWNTDVCLDECPVRRSNEMELCRFQYQEGARLRNEYTDFKDCATEYNVINRLHAEYSTVAGTGISPIIMRCFADELSKKKINDPADMMFLTECRKGEAIHRKTVKDYIKYKINKDSDDVSNENLFISLLEVLDGIEGAKTSTKAHDRQRMIII